MQKLTLNGKITVFKALAMSHIPSSTMKELTKRIYLEQQKIKKKYEATMIMAA